MSNWNPDSSQKLEGKNLSGNVDISAMAQAKPNTDYAPDDNELLGGGAYGPDMDGGELTAGDMQESSDPYNDVVGDRLPGAPRPRSDTDDPRPVANLIQAGPSIRRVAPLSDAVLMALSRQSYDNSENYFNSSHRTRIIDAMARFNSEHPKGSKYWNPAFEKRSKLFRPKTRATVRKREAAATIALFSSSDVVSVQATRSDPDAKLDARIQEALLNYRLTADQRWYKLVVGAVQDAERQGFAIGKTYWEYEESNQYFDENHPTLGTVGRVDTVAKIDRPGMALVPLERMFFSPASDWMNLIESSPYLIEVIPMFLCNVREYANNPRARLKYRALSTSQLLSGGKSSEWDSIRTQRERNAQNRYDRGSDVADYAIVWVHRNIMRIQGEDYVYDTVGTHMMLSNVIPLSEFDPRGYRPYVAGSTLIESHNPYNVGGVTLMGQMQDEVNETANLRVDANKMATAGRMFVKRNTSLDLHALARFSPGAVVEMDNPAQDIKWDRSPEAPSGIFEENQLLNTELDDLMGNFSLGTVGNARNLNETVGGMQMIGASADQITEYDVHTFCTTFVTQMLGQLMDLEKQWETDNNLAAIIGSKLAASARKFWQALGTETKVTVNVGYGATNPQKRMERIGMAVNATMTAAPQLMQMADQGEIAQEIWAAAGFSDATRFFPFLDDKGQETDPKVKALQLQVQQLQAAADPVQAQMKNRTDIENLRQQGQLKIAQLKGQQAVDLQERENKMALNIKVLELKLAYVELQLEKEKNDIARAQLMLEREKLSNDITMERLQFNLERLTAQASLAAPVVAQDPDAEAESEQLRAPGSNLALPDFSQNVATASEYVNANEGSPS